LERGVSLERLERILAETSARFFLGKHSAKRLPDGVCILDTAELCENCANAEEIPWDYPVPSGDETAEILFSTGTTGKSKGIELTHSNVIAVAENVVYGVEMQPGNVEMIFAPLSHSHGLRRHYANLLRGNAVVLCESVVFVQSVFELIDRYAVTAMDIVPSAMKMLLKLSGSRLAGYGGQLRYVQLGSAPLDKRKKSACASCFRKRAFTTFTAVRKRDAPASSTLIASRIAPAALENPPSTAKFELSMKTATL
jgi:acyl-coenzyme A synthetase/AMP-(fatty) acid ligase